MAEESALSKKNLKTINPDKRDVLEELDLPPQLIKFLRENSKNLIIALACVTVAYIGWIIYGSYAEKQLNKSTAMLTQAMKDQGETKISELNNVVSDYSGTDAALWARVELAHNAAADGNYEDAIAQFSTVLDDMSAKNSVRPLVIYDLAQAYEANDDLDKAETFYQQLLSFENFSNEGYRGLARIYEAQGNIPKAVESYEQIINKGDSQLLAQGWIEDRLATLKAEMQPRKTVEPPAE